MKGFGDVMDEAIRKLGAGGLKGFPGGIVWDVGPVPGPEQPVEKKKKKTGGEAVSELQRLLGSIQEEGVRDIVRHELAQNGPSIGTAIAEAMRPHIDHAIEEAAVRAANQHVQIKSLEVKVREQVNVVNGPHPKLQEAVEISSAINNLWLCGPAGSGKTTLAGQLADALGVSFGFISCTSGMSESKLLGRMNVHGTYLPAEFVRIYEEGGVFLWDEFDAADPNVVLCANAAMANGHLSVPDRTDRPIAKRHPNTILVIATNTWGRGSTSEYTARETLDAATRDRFVLSKIEVDYSAAIEAQFLGAYQPRSVVHRAEIATRHPLPETLMRIRENIGKHHLRRVLSTRVFVQAAALRAIGWSDQKILERYFLDWSEAERTKALEGLC